MKIAIAIVIAAFVVVGGVFAAFHFNREASHEMTDRDAQKVADALTDQVRDKVEAAREESMAALEKFREQFMTPEQAWQARTDRVRAWLAAHPRPTPEDAQRLQEEDPEIFLEASLAVLQREAGQPYEPTMPQPEPGVTFTAAETRGLKWIDAHPGVPAADLEQLAIDDPDLYLEVQKVRQKVWDMMHGPESQNR